MLFLIVTIPTYIPTNNAHGFPSFTCSPTLIMCHFDDNYSERYEVISHCGFDLHSVDD